MTEEQYDLYCDAVDEACQAAGTNDGHWNMRFCVALDRRGLTLVPLDPQNLENYIQAPKPVAGEFPTWDNALIVPRT